MEYSTASHTIEDREKFESFIHSLEEGDCIVTQNLWVLSNNMDEIVKIINCLLTHKVDLHIAESNTLLRRETSVTEIFPLLNLLNEKKREKKNQIGRPKGSRSSSKFDPYQSQIIALLREKMSVSAIARELSVSRSSLKDYIESRELRRLINESWVELSRNSQNNTQAYQNSLLICPFEENHNKETTS